MDGFMKTLFCSQSIKPMPLFRISLLFLLFFFPGLLFSQEQQYQFSHIGIKDGLPQENTSITQQDKKGYIWIASGSYLQRYDGYRFITFRNRKGDSTSIPSGNITGLQIDQQNRLWILTSDYIIGYLNVEDFKFHPVKIKWEEKGPNRPNALYVSKDNRVILIYPRIGYLTFDEQQNHFSYHTNPFQIPEKWQPNYIWQDNNMNYWIGCEEGLIKFNPTSKKLSYREHNSERDPVIEKFKDAVRISYAFLDSFGNFWIMSWADTEMYIRSLDIKTGKTIDWQHRIGEAMKGIYYILYSITQTKNGDLWMAGANVFAKVDLKRDKVLPIKRDNGNENTLRYDNIHFIYEDRESNIWLNTDKGLYRFNPPAQKFTPVYNRAYGSDSIYTSESMDVVETDDGLIHIGTWGNGIFSYNKNFEPVPPKLSDIKRYPQQIMNWCMVKAKNGDVWSGMQGGYVFVDKATTKKRKGYKPAAFNGVTVRQVVEDSTAQIWFGSHRGQLVKYIAKADSFKLIQHLNATISRMYVDNKNDLWVSTDVNGIYIINTKDGTIKNHYSNNGFEKNKGLMAAGVSDVVQYDDSTMVIASGGLNFLHTNTGKFTYLNIDNGLTSPDVANLVVDKDGFIWMTSMAGILSYHPTKNRMSTYGTEDGVHTNSFNIASSGTLKDGRIIFGTAHEFIIFDPKKVTAPVLETPKVFISGIEVMNRPLRMDSVKSLQKLELDHFEHSLSIALSTLTYQNLFRTYYKMEGLSNDWIEVGKNNQVLFTYLIPGNYTFKTACRDEFGNYVNITSIAIHIRSPFYQTWWFYALLLLAGGALFYWLDRERMRRKEVIPQMRNDISTNLHQEINLALSNINILSEIAKMKADKEPEKSKEFIEQIRTKSHNMMIAMDDMLWSINPENDSMQKTIERMQEYIDALNIRHDASIEILVDKKVHSLELNMRARYDLIHFFKEYMTGLVNSGAEKCRVHLSFEKQQLLFTIEIDNSTCDPQKLNNLLQRQDLAQRLDLIHGKMTTQKLNSNTVIMLYLPID